MIRRRRNILILAIVGGIFVIVIAALGAINISLAPVFTLVLYAGLIVVTMFYVYYSMEISNAAREQTEEVSQQAQATLRMAEEMKEQRYDTVRPVIDINRDPSDEDKMSETTAINCNDTSVGLHFMLSNIGIGPALDVETVTQFGSGRQLQSLGTIAKGGEQPHWSLSLEQPDGRTTVVVSYRDVYGRCFQSSREIIKNKDKGLQIGSLKTVPIPEDKGKND